MGTLTVLLAASLLTAIPAQQVGDTCRTNTGAAGECKEVSQCEWAPQQIKDGIQMKTCFFKQPEDVPVICCAPGGRIGYLTEQSRRSKSYQKCLEYSEALSDRSEVPVLTLTTVVSNHTTCAITSDGVGLIANGVKAHAEEFPHMALLGFGPANNIAWKCGGSLISEKFILTAAHCLFDRETRTYVAWARLGDMNITSAHDDENAETLGVVARHAHPNYNASSYYNDIALLELEEEVDFTTHHRPACIHHMEGFDSPQLVALVSGWGKTSNWGGISDVLRKADLKFVEHRVCYKKYKYLSGTSRLLRGIDRSSQICAADPHGRQDTCQGDSGGPIQLVLSEPPCMYNVVGVTSFGPTNCGAGNQAAVYTRIQHYLPWIENIVWTD